MAQRPNIVLLLADQQKATSLPLYGNPDVRAPHLEALAARGVVAQHFYVQHPWCLPSRACFLSGRYPQATRVHRNSHHFPRDLISIAEVLADAGYRTGAIGHLHGRENCGRGFHYVYDLGDGKLKERQRELHERSAAAPRRIAHMTATLPHGPDDSGDGLQTTAALEFLEAAARTPEQPFFLHIAWFQPHPPYFVGEPYASMYDPARLTLPPPEPADGNKPARYAQAARDMGVLGAPEAEIRTALAYYYGMCSSVDDQVGRLVDGLRRLRLDHNTIVVFSSDHGDYAGEHHMFGKTCTVYDCLVRVPFIIAGPDDRVPQGMRLDGLVESVDVTPTLLDLAGVPPPVRMDLQGDSLRRLWDAPGAGSGQGREFEVDGFDVAYAEVGGVGREQVRNAERGNNVPHGPPASGRQAELTAMLRTREWKYVHTPGRELDELYHLPSDPWELRNRWGRGEHEAMVAGFKERLLDWRLAYR